MNQTEFGEQVEAVKLQLYKTAFLYLGNEASSLEVVDESIFKALKALKSLRQPEFFTTWITRIVINECYKELRRLKRLYPEEYLQLEEGKEYDLDHLSLREAIKRLPEELKSVIILRYFTGLTQAQTAKSLSIPQGTVVTRQRKALGLLKLELSEEE